MVASSPGDSGRDSGRPPGDVGSDDGRIAASRRPSRRGGAA